MKQDILIIGGGASGLAAAILAARKGAAVTILEHTDRVGKKLLSTGNGRCNLTNRNMGPQCYRSQEADFPMKVIGGFGLEETLEFFRTLGIEPKDRNGYIYPASDQASSVLDALRMELDHLGVRVAARCQVERIQPPFTEKPGGGFLVFTNQGQFQARALILAAGSKAAPNTGSDGSGYQLALSLGHRIIKPLPALVQLRCQGKHYRQLAGVRTEARVTLKVDGRTAAQDTGELQLTDYGISGIPVFQVSRFAAVALDQGKRVEAEIDFLPSWPYEEALNRLRERVKLLSYRTCEEFLSGLLNKKLAQVLIKSAGIPLSRTAGTLKERELRQLLEYLKSYRALVSSVNPFANAQVCRGGVDVSQVNPETMESKLIPGLYFAGEILDVDGICGGYNLQFAWSSAAAAARAAAGRAKTGAEARQENAGSAAGQAKTGAAARRPGQSRPQADGQRPGQSRQQASGQRTGGPRKRRQNP